MVAKRSMGVLPRSGSASPSVRGRAHAGLVLFLLVMLALRFFVVERFVVEGSSMYETFHGGEHVLVNKVAYRIGAPARGDVVVASAGQVDVIKRVVAVGGETVEVRGCLVLVDGRTLPKVASDGCGPGTGPTAVPAGHVYLLGDNRGESLDSRGFGPVAVADVVGRVDVVVWPPSSWSLP
jgi:signal peptidase I